MPRHPTKLAEYLHRHDVGLSEFSRTAGMSRQVMWHYVRGDRRPGVKYALAIASATRGAVPASYWSDFQPTKPGRPAKRVRRARRSSTRRSP